MQIPENGDFWTTQKCLFLWLSNAHLSEDKDALTASLQSIAYTFEELYRNSPKQSDLLDSPVITRREKEVLSLIAQGFTTSQISEKIFISSYLSEYYRYLFK